MTGSAGARLDSDDGGPNVAIEHVCGVFSSIIDVVVHTAKEPSAAVVGGAGGRRKVMEILAVPTMPTNEFDFTVEPIFQREVLRP